MMMMSDIMTYNYFFDNNNDDGHGDDDDDDDSFHRQLSGMKPFIMLSLCYGAGVGILSSLVTIMDQLLLPHGYSNVRLNVIG